MVLRDGRINDFVDFSLKACSGVVGIWVLSINFYINDIACPPQPQVWRMPKLNLKFHDSNRNKIENHSKTASTVFFKIKLRLCQYRVCQKPVCQDHVIFVNIISSFSGPCLMFDKNMSFFPRPCHVLSTGLVNKFCQQILLTGLVNKFYQTCFVNRFCQQILLTGLVNKCHQTGFVNRFC